MSKINLAFAINDHYVEPLNIALYSLLKNNPKNTFNVYVLCKSLTQDNKQLIYKIQKHYKNVKIEIVELGLDAGRFDSLKLNIEYISIETYYRYVLAELFPGLDKIIYLDADILVTGDLNSLYETDIQDFYIAGVSDEYVASIEENGVNYKESIGFARNELYVNAGVLLMNLKKFRKDDIIPKLFANSVQLANKVKLQDQDILNITLQGKVMELPNEFNYTDIAKRDDKKTVDDIMIIHYNGSSKPWENTYIAKFQEPFVKLYKDYAKEYHQLIYGSSDKFALYTFSTENIGDDIQAIAARRFLPRVDYLINRDLIGEWDNFDQTETVKLIANSWYMHTPHKWPIQDKTIDALYVSMYVEQGSAVVVEKMLSKKSRDNFKKFGSVGARDETTYQFFKENNINAYLSGCVTLTLQRDKNIKKQDFILLTDVSPAVYEYVKRATSREIIYLTNATTTPNMTPAQRQELAEIYLYLYQSAHCVITERLHSVLPSLAFETPSLLIKKNEPVGGNKNRFAGLGELAHYYSEQDFLSGTVYDFENPPKNPNKYLTYRNQLIKTCSKFTGFNNEVSFSRSDIGKKTFKEVQDRFEYIKATILKNATTEIMNMSYEKETMLNLLEQKTTKIEQQNSEVARLMGVKASAKRLGGNIKRRIVGKVNGQ